MISVIKELYKYHHRIMNIMWIYSKVVHYSHFFLVSLSCKAITDYIDQQFERYLQEELKIKRGLVSFHDTRIHACLYFVCPTGHS